MKNGRKKKHMLTKIIIAIAALGILSFGMLMGYVWIEEKKVPSELSELQTDFDAVIVLGAQVQADGTPSVQLTWRLDRALDVWLKKQVTIVVCGAQGKNEPEPEAVTMKKYLNKFFLMHGGLCLNLFDLHGQLLAKKHILFHALYL